MSASAISLHLSHPISTLSAAALEASTSPGLARRGPYAAAESFMAARCCVARPSARRRPRPEIRLSRAKQCASYLTQHRLLDFAKLVLTSRFRMQYNHRFLHDAFDLITLRRCLFDGARNCRNPIFELEFMQKAEQNGFPAFLLRGAFFVDGATNPCESNFCAGSHAKS